MDMKFRMTPAILLGITVASAPVAFGQTGATREAPRDKTNASQYSDRDRMTDWNKGEDALERALKTGENKEFYREELKKLGFIITAVNYDRPDYVEWEVVKGDQSYEIQIDFTGGKSSEVDVATNMWRADATTQAMQGKKVAAAG